MRHRKYKRKFSRTPAHRRAMLSNLLRSLLHFEQIQTTEAKAKSLKALADRIISRAQEDTVHARRLVEPVIKDRNLIHKLFHHIGPAVEGEGGGGYVRVVRTARRHGDSASMAVVELVHKTQLYYDRRKAEEEARKAKKEEARKAAEKSREAAQAAGGAPVAE
jgi:large subunit ribosomal protein L17